MSTQTGQKAAFSPHYLNPDLKSPLAQEFEDKLTALIVGQDRAVRRLTGLYQIYLAGLSHPGRPIGTMIFLGPTGSGKTRVVEAAANEHLSRIWYKVYPIVPEFIAVPMAIFGGVPVVRGKTLAVRIVIGLWVAYAAGKCKRVIDRWLLGGQHQ